MFAVCARLAGAVQYFSTEPADTEVNPGSVAVLRCVVADKSALAECVWQHDRLPVRLQEVELLVELETKAKRRYAKISQSRRRPLLGPSPG